MMIGNTKSISKPAFFEYVHYKPHPKQWLLHNSTARFRMAACGIRFGKSYSAAFDALSMLMYSNVRGWIVAPNYELTDKVFREIYSYSINYLKPFIAAESYNSKYIRFIWGSEVFGKSADNPISLAGESLDFIIVDEAPAIKEIVWTHFLRERLADRKGWVLFIGTPRGRNWYYHMYLKGLDSLEKDYESFHFTTYDNPYIDREEIEAMRRQLPERAFSQEVLAEFLSDADAVFHNVNNCVGKCLRPPEKGKSYTGGLDIARRVDYNVLTLADEETNEIVYYDRWNCTSWGTTYKRVAAVVHKYNDASFWMDYTGVGDPVFETLKYEYGLNVKPFGFTNTSKMHLIDNLTWFFENERIVIPDVPEMLNELEVFERSVTPGGRESFGAPDGYHDDIVISLGLTALSLNRGSLFVDVLDVSKFG